MAAPMTIDAAVKVAADLTRLIGGQWSGRWAAYDRATGEPVGTLTGSPEPGPGRVVLQVPELGSRPVSGATVLRADRAQHNDSEEG